MDPLVEYPPHALRDYALLADGERGALIGPRGDLAWMCVPHWESDAAFSTLIGGNGCYAVTPAGRYTWGGHYEPRSLIWNSRWVTTDGIVESREALAMPADPATAVILRRVRVISGRARVRVLLDVRAGFGSAVLRRTHRDSSGTWTGESDSLSFRWSGAAEAHRAGRGPLVLELDLAAGEVRDLVLEIGAAKSLTGPPEPHTLWNDTEAGWRDAVPDLGPDVLGSRDAEHAFAVLLGLTSAGGGMVAAATMSLPERAQEGRNYDYRYAWIRDQCYAGIAVAKHGHFPLLDSAVDFVSDRLLSDGPGLKPAYSVRGEAVPGERSLSHLSGYPGGSDKVGNWVNKQFQLDAFGEALELFGSAAALDRLESKHWEAAETAVAAIESRFTEPDAGIWEIDNQRWTHSRLTCVSGLRAIAAQAPASQSGRWSALADTILADASADCLHPDGRWQRSPGDPRIDAALLLPAIRGAVPRSDPRTIATIAAVEHELFEHDFVYRFRQDNRPLGEAEGAFLLCGFLLALAKEQQGQHLAARSLFDRNRSASGTPGLLAEEFDVEQRQLRGNLPQAFVHALLLECSVDLAASAVDVGGS
jgi:GH15 family glucan-1,4-alpha-glucosidase